MRRPALGLVALVTLSSLVRAAAAADGASANELLRAGVKLRYERQDEAALALFERAEAMAPTPVARAQMALAEQALGRWLEAEVDLRGALETDRDEWIVANRAALDLARDEIAKHLAWLTVDVGVPSVEVSFDGSPVPPSTETRLVARSGTLDVRAAGFARFTRRIDLVAEEHAHLTITLTPLAAEPSPDRPPAATPRARPLGPVILAALGVAGIGVGAYFGILTFVDKAARDAQCHGGVCPMSAAADDASARTSAEVSTVAFTAGLALAAGAAAWWLLDAPSPRPRVAWRVLPVVGARTVGAGFVGALP